MAEGGLDRGGRRILRRLGLFRTQLARQRSGRRFVKCAQEIADLDAIVVIERQARRDLLVVDKGAVAALEVLNVVLALDVQDLRVVTADGRAADRHLAIRIPPQDDGIFHQLDPLSRVRPFENQQRCHDYSSPTGGGERGL